MTIYAWVVVRADGTAVRNTANGALGVFEEKKDAQKVAHVVNGSRVIPCTITYKV